MWKRAGKLGFIVPVFLLRALVECELGRTRRIGLTARRARANRRLSVRRPHSPQQSVRMLGAITTLLVYQLVGEVLVQFLILPVPGPVVGMLLLFLSLWLKGSIPDGLHMTANTILQHLSLLFVPAGVGVMVHFSRVSGEVVPIVVAVLGSTALAITAAALTMQALIGLRRRGAREKQL